MLMRHFPPARYRLVDLQTQHAAELCFGHPHATPAVTEHGSGQHPLPVVATENWINIPAGSKVISVTPSENGLTVHVQKKDGTTRVQLHGPDGALLNGYDFKEQP